MLPYFVLLAALVAWGGFVAWRWKSARDFAHEVLAVKQKEGELPASVSPDEFQDLYLRSEGPRGMTYLFVCAAIVLLLLAPFVAAFNAIWTALWVMTGQSPVFETGTLIHTFSIFLAYFGTTVALLATAMRRYHALAPPNFKQVLRDLNGAAR